MSISIILWAALASVDVSIVEPADEGIFGGDWLTLRAIVQNDSVLPDSVVFSLNGEPSVPVPRLVTDWYTYMQNDLHHGCSLSPAPMTNDLLWTAPVTGDYHEFCNPVIVDGVVYYVSDGLSTAFALDAATGGIVWQYDVVDDVDDAVTWYDGKVYAAADSAWCLDALTGQRIWAYGGAVRRNMNGSPAVGGGIAYFTSVLQYSSTKVLALDAGTGVLIWSADFPHYTTGCLTLSGERLYLPTYLGPLYALDAGSGEILWENTVTEEGYWDTSPTIVDGKIYIGGEDGAVHRFDALTGDLEWETSLGDYSVEPTPAVFEETVICGHTGSGSAPGVLAALDMSDGSIVWSIPTSIHGSPAVAGGIVYWGGFWDPYDLIHAADASTGEIIWEYDPDPGTIGLQSTPAIVDGVMYYASTDDNLYAFGTGLKWTYRDDLYADIGSNELIVDSWSGGSVVASDTVSFTVTQTGLEPGPGAALNLAATPNPFSSTATISFEMPVSGHGSLQVFDLAGRLVTDLESGFLETGSHSVVWDGTTRSGERVFPGCYLVRFTSGGEASSMKLLVVTE